MNIQSYIDRKRIAGAREHEGNKTDWAGWTQEQFLAAIAGELLDAAAYAQRAMEVAFECGNKDLFDDANDTLLDLFGALCNFKDEILEAACQEAERELEAETVPNRLMSMLREVQENCPKAGLQEFALKCFNWIEELREQAGLTRREYAVLAGVASDYENRLLNHAFYVELGILLRLLNATKQEAKQ